MVSSSENEKTKRYSRTHCRVCLRPYTPEIREAQRVKHMESIERSILKRQEAGEQIDRAPKYDHAKMHMLSDNGFTPGMIANMLGCHESTVDYVLKRSPQRNKFKK